VKVLHQDPNTFLVLHLASLEEAVDAARRANDRLAAVLEDASLLFPAPHGSTATVTDPVHGRAVGMRREAGAGR
jgi:hypothetical protein